MADLLSTNKLEFSYQFGVMLARHVCSRQSLEKQINLALEKQAKCNNYWRFLDYINIQHPKGDGRGRKVIKALHWLTELFHDDVM